MQSGYILKVGKDLVHSIESENWEEILYYLEKAYREIHLRFSDEFDETLLNQNVDEIRNEESNIDNLGYTDLTAFDIENNINWLLETFYDYCDAFNISII